MMRIMKKKIYAVIFVICLIGFCIAAGILIRNAYVQYRSEKELDELIAEMNEAAAVQEPLLEMPTEAETESESEAETEATEDAVSSLGVEIPEKELDWDALAETNEDIYAWLYVPDTNIDYPVLQHPEERSFYLMHNLDGSYGYPGCIYTQNLNEKDFSDPMTVVYGHNMKDGSMFRTLHYFEDGEFFETHPYFYIYTPEGTLVYEVFAAYKFGDADLLLSFDFYTPESFGYYLINVMDQRDMEVHTRSELDADLDGYSRCVTLSTCVSGESDKRYLVQAVLVGDEAGSTDRQGD